MIRHAYITLIRAWHRRQVNRWMTLYTQAITWHSHLPRAQARAMAAGVLNRDPSAPARRDPTHTALRDLGIPAEVLS